MIHVWIETLDLPAAAAAVLRSLRRTVRLHVGAMTPRAGRLVRWRERRSKGRLTVTRHALGGLILDENGVNVFARIQTRFALVGAALAEQADSYRWLPEEYRPYGDLWLRAMAADVLTECGDHIVFLSRMEALYRNGAVDPRDVDRVEAWLPAAGFTELVARAFQPRIAAPTLIRVRPGFRPLGARQPHLLHLLRYLYGLVRESSRPGEERVAEAAAGRGALLVQMEPDTLRTWPDAGILDWHVSSGVPAERVILLVNRRDTPISRDMRERMRTSGFGWVRDRGSALFQERPVRAALRAAWRMRTAFPRRPTADATFRWTRAVEYAIRIEGMRALIRRRNIIAIMLGWDSFNSEQLLLTAAGRMEDAATLLSVWSVYPFIPGWLHRAAGDAVFTWGAFHRGFFRRIDCDGPRLDVGVCGIDGPGGDAAAAAAVRARFSDRVGFVVVLFDSSHGDNCYMPTSAVTTFYRTVLDAVRVRPDWGCVIKPKSDIPHVSAETADIHETIDALTAEGRCVVMEREERAATAALAGDAAVSCGLGTAGFIAALAGKPSLLADVARTPHPLKADPAFARTAPAPDADLGAALEAVRAGTGGIGDPAAWQALIDPFGDWRGRVRKGEAIRDYVDGRDRGLGAAAALRAMAARFAESWGAARVSVDGATEETEADRLWRALLERQTLHPWPEPWPTAVPRAGEKS